MCIRDRTGSSGDWERLVRGVIREFEENNSGVGMFHFDSDADVFCVYSQDIDDLMMLAKMIRVACADEKAMRTNLGKIEYIKLFWEGAPEGEPPVIFYEVDTENERLAHRSIDIFADGRTHKMCIRDRLETHQWKSGKAYPLLPNNGIFHQAL